MADKSIGRRMYENVMGTPEQNEAAEKRMEARDKKNPDSMPAKINRAAKAVTGGKSKAGESATENMKEYGMKSGGMTASARADGIAQRGKTRGKIC